MGKLYFLFSLLLWIICLPVTTYAQDWRDNMKNLVYTPDYFGPNAFPIPELRSGKIDNKRTVELRYDYHQGTGDRTQNLYGRLFLPFGNGKAALEVSGVIIEDYKTTEITRIIRHAANAEPANNEPCFGDFILTSFFQLTESDKWFDSILSVGLKTASGNMLCDARYTDAASYWIDIHAGKNVWATNQSFFRLSLMLGFYCYMTNSDIHRQNDAWMTGTGFQSGYRHWQLDADIRGFKGYWEDGDNPWLIQTRLQYNIKKHSFFTRYQYGLNDYNRDRCFSGGYAFHF